MQAEREAARALSPSYCGSGFSRDGEAGAASVSGLKPLPQSGFTFISSASGEG